jgi:NADPH:quinone reductase-like Zn-dependent oxidoreductase
LAAIVYQFFYELYWCYLVKPSFKGKVIMVTGASSGIGEQLAK